MRVMVTGACGVNGVWVVRELLERGHEVVAVDRVPDGAAPPGAGAPYRFEPADVRDTARLARMVREQRYDAIVHLAALVGYPGGCADPKLAFEVNVGGTIAVLEAAVVGDVRRVVFASSKAAYGEVGGAHARPTYAPVAEDHVGRPLPPSFLSVYAASKLASEQLGINYHAAFGVQFAALRFARICAPGKLTTRHGPMSIDSRMIEDAARGVPTLIPRGGDERDDIVYVRDVARSFAHALEADGLGAGVYNIGQGRPFALGDVADAVRRRIPGARIEIGPGHDFLGLGFSVYSVFDIGRARRELGFEPAWDLDAMVGDYLRTIEAEDAPRAP